MNPPDDSARARMHGESPTRAARRRIRAADHRHHTAGLADSFVQANVCILPKAWADDFLLYCQRNPKPCPLLAVSDVGDPRLPALGQDIDIRSDVPAYCIFRDGELVDEMSDISGLWRDDLVTFALGCSFSFEWALLEAGIRLKHIERGESVSMYVTNVDTERAGRFHGKLVVSMRPLEPADAIRAIQVTSRFPRVHGAPVHLGSPSAIGIERLDQPYLGIGTTDVAPDELPVFWACGVTPHSAITAARPPLAITHKPGHMLITDLANASLASF
ncbi:MAG TPA: putative hydro-lyase [Casimicrobiaceae bacterium]|nr:putative hydro-lyase [Casimicrobiaceae bacterium]